MVRIANVCPGAKKCEALTIATYARLQDHGEQSDVGTLPTTAVLVIKTTMCHKINKLLVHKLL